MGFLRSRLFRFIASLGLAAIFYFLCPPCFSKVNLGLVLALLVLIINIPKVFGYKYLTHLTRIAVGGLFIFSGFIKANDPEGFSIKLKEYFEVFDAGFSCEMKPAVEASGIPCEQEHKQKVIDDKFHAIIERADAKFQDSSWADAKKIYQEALLVKPSDTYAQEQITSCNAQLGIPKPTPPEPGFMHSVWMFFADHSVFLAIFICGFEVAVGIFLLLGLQVRWTLLILLLMIIFFSFLTFYSACCNKVTSCGCFGDAIKLTPWESFWKDLILLILIAVLFVGEQNIKPPFKNSIVVACIAGIGLFLSFAFPVYTYRHLPILDFRPYKIGTNLFAASKVKDPKTTGCQPDSMRITYYYQNTKTGQIIHFLSTHMDSFPSDTNFQYYCREDLLVRKGNCNPTVLDFNLVNPETEEILTDSILQLKGVQFFLVMNDLNEAERSPMPKVNAFFAECQKHNTIFNGLSNGSVEMVASFRKETGAQYPMLTVDGTALKTVIRSNPGLVMLKDGTVIAMWHYNDVPTYNEAMEKSRN